MSTSRTLLIRADASSKIGTGHVMRCLALAQAWQDRGGKVTFFSHCPNEKLQQMIVAQGFGLELVKNPHPASGDMDQIEAAVRLGQWLVLDGYHFDPDYQKAARKAGYKVLVIDDTAHQSEYHADILLNQNIHAENLNYSTNPDATRLFGTRYAMLRREFLRCRESERKTPDRAKSILVTLGGSDPGNVTLKVIEALKLLGNKDLEVWIVAGPANLHFASLEKALQNAPFKAKIMSTVMNMPELMTWADLAISAAGSTCWELAFMGVPMVLITVADNQEGIGSGLAQAGAALSLGRSDGLSEKHLAKEIAGVLESSRLLTRLSEEGPGIVDGYGVNRVVEAMQPTDIMLRTIQPSDCRLLWEWANDPVARKVSFSSAPISFGDHRSWFSDRMADQKCVLYMAENQNCIPVGQARFEILDGKANISVTLAPQFRNAGLGSEFIRQASKACLAGEKVKSVQALVKQENLVSIRAFEKAGYRKTGCVSHKGFKTCCLVYGEI